MNNQILLDNDPFYISSRIKEVDENYFIVFSKKKNCFELHNSGQLFSTFALTIPYPELDERTIFLARKSRKENADRLIREMDENNSRLEKKRSERVFEQIKEVTNEIKRSNKNQL